MNPQRETVLNDTRAIELGFGRSLLAGEFTVTCELQCAQLAIPLAGQLSQHSPLVHDGLLTRVNHDAPHRFGEKGSVQSRFPAVL